MAADIAAAPTASDDERRLHELGYAQELMRRMSGFSNFAVSFTIISILSGCLTLYYFGMDEGGPAIIVWGWPIVGIMTLLVGLSMAEVCSSFPTAGGLYYWAAKLAPRNGAAWSWFTGYFNFLGQVAVTAGIDFGAAYFINFLFSLWFNFDTTTQGHTIVIYAAVLLLHRLLNQFGIRLVALLNDVSVWWHIFGVLIIVGALIFGLKAGAYHASAHMTEETHNAARSGPRGIVMSILISLIAGWILLIGVTFAIQKGNYLNEAAAGAAAPAQIWIDSIGRTGAELLLLVVIGAQLFCGMSSVTANSRMIYAFSRDGALPGSRIWHRVNKRTRTPTNAIWLAAGGALILGLPYLWNGAAYGAVTSIATIGLYVAYVIPTFLRLRQGSNFNRGPWHLGRFSYVIGTIAVIWVVIIFFLFMLPQFGPIRYATFNYACIAVAVVIGYASLTWALSARKWFTGPKVQGSAAELAAIERELPGLMPPVRRGMLSLDELRDLAGRGEIDTVVLAFTDMQGRLAGKRLSAEFFLDEVAEAGSEGCNYLLAVDVDMNTVDGYAMSSWERGYGDFVLAPAMSTLRRLPWQDGTALVLAGLTWLDGTPVTASPRQILAAQLDRLASRGWTAMAGTELEFIVYADSYESAAARGYRDLTPANQYNVDYSILGTARIEPLLRKIRLGMAGAGLYVESAKGECNLGQHEIAFRYTDALTTCDNHSLYRTGAKEIAAQDGMSITFMAKPNEREGNSCHIHLSLRSVRDGSPVLAGSGPYGLSRVGEHFLAGLLDGTRELTLCYAPNINSYKRYVPGSFAPTAVRWGPDNRTCAMRLVGHGPSLRVENRVPGGDVNPYLAIAAMIASGLHGIEHELPLEPAAAGNAYLDNEASHVPSTLRDALELWQKSTLARTAFGAEVVEHYANYARVELAAYDAAVTDWELRRGLERL